MTIIYIINILLITSITVVISTILFFLDKELNVRKNYKKYFQNVMRKLKILRNIDNDNQTQILKKDDLLENLKQSQFFETQKIFQINQNILEKFVSTLIIEHQSHLEKIILSIKEKSLQKEKTSDFFTDFFPFLWMEIKFPDRLLLENKSNYYIPKSVESELEPPLKSLLIFEEILSHKYKSLTKEEKLDIIFEYMENFNASFNKIPNLEIMLQRFLKELVASYLKSKYPNYEE